MEAAGDVAAHPLAGIEAVTWSPLWRNKMETAIDELASQLPAFESAAASFMALIIGTDGASDYQALQAMVTLAGQLLKPEACTAIAFMTERGDTLRHAIANLRGMQETARTKRRRLRGRYRPAIYEQDHARRLLEEWKTATNATFIFRGNRQKNVRWQLETFADSLLPTDPGDDLAILAELAELEKEARRLGPAFTRFGAIWQGLDTSVERLDALVAWAFETRRVCDRAAAMGGLDASVLRERVTSLLTEYPESFDFGGKAQAACGALQATAAAASEAIERLGRLAGMADPTQPPATGPAWMQASVTTATQWKAHLNQAPAWSNWKTAVVKARDAGLGSLVTALEHGELGRDELDHAFEVAYARWWIDRIVTEDPILREFIVTRQEDSIARFQAADARVGEIAKKIVRARLGGDIPSPTTFGTDPEWGTLARELVKKTRHMPLRKLFAQIPTALTRLTPCVMMSPLSIAQYLPADARPFDVVLFDEASQELLHAACQVAKQHSRGAGPRRDHHRHRRGGRRYRAPIRRPFVRDTFGVNAFPAAAVDDPTAGIRGVARAGPRLRYRQTPQPGQVRHRGIAHSGIFRSAQHGGAAADFVAAGIVDRLCGDRHPLHSYPEFAAAVGFPRRFLTPLLNDASRHNTGDGKPEETRPNFPDVEVILASRQIARTTRRVTLHARPCLPRTLDNALQVMP